MIISLQSIRTNLKLVSHIINVIELCSLRSYSKYLTDILSIITMSGSN
jgi:hypothetical protein